MEKEKKYPCPMCKSPNQIYLKDFHEICQVCGWEDDEYQLKYPDEVGPNKMTFNEAREKWKRGEQIYPDFQKK